MDAVGSCGMTLLTTRGMQLCRESHRQLFGKLGEDACDFFGGRCSAEAAVPAVGVAQSLLRIFL